MAGLRDSKELRGDALKALVVPIEDSQAAEHWLSIRKGPGWLFNATPLSEGELG